MQNFETDDRGQNSHPAPAKTAPNSYLACSIEMIVSKKKPARNYIEYEYI